MQHTTTSRQRRSRTIGYHALVRLVIIIFVLTLTVQTQAQWDIQNSHTTASLRGIDSLGDGVAWASGTNGTILRTEDGGFVWQLCAIPPGAQKLDFRGIQAFDANTAIVMSSGKGDLSRLYKTTDGCQTWKLVFTNPDKDGFWDALHFYTRFSGKLDRKQGLVIGDPVDGIFPIFFTYDEGESWHRWGDQSNAKSLRPAKANKNEALFAASNSSIVSPGINESFCFVTGGAGGSRFVYAQQHSPFDVDRWEAFSSVGLPLPANVSAGAFSIARRSREKRTDGIFVIVGGDYKTPESGASAVITQPHRFLNTSIQKSQTPPHGYRSAVAFDPATQNWITVGPNGTDISRDDGRNWTPLKPTKAEPADADKNWNALSLPFVVGPNGRIGKLNPSSLKP